MFHKIGFTPLAGFKSPDAQMILSNFSWNGSPPPSSPLWINVSYNDMLCCAVSTPSSWTLQKKTVVLVHGLGGDQTSPYLVRIARKLYSKGLRVVRVNLRGCGPGKNLSKLPYNGGTSPDILAVLNRLKTLAPQSSITLIGFSLGGNICLKMLGELGTGAELLVDRAIAVCPPIDLGDTVESICSDRNKLYHYYYLNSLLKQTKRWNKGKSIKSVFEFDEKVTAPEWGYASAADYYEKCSGARFISQIAVHTDILFSEDDPFISYHMLEKMTIPTCVTIWLTRHGGHMGFIGWPGSKYGFHWMDNHLIKWVGTP